ncbi:MAG: hypothetical protein AABZ55_11440 [Bdellovibrionota bacterium]
MKKTIFNFAVIISITIASSQSGLAKERTVRGVAEDTVFGGCLGLLGSGLVDDLFSNPYDDKTLIWTGLSSTAVTCYPALTAGYSIGTTSVAYDRITANQSSVAADALLKNGEAPVNSRVQVSDSVSAQ